MDVLKEVMMMCLNLFRSGEENKHLNTIQDMYKFFIENHLDRNSLIFALGGGVTGDMAGFAAAIIYEAFLYSVPTTSSCTSGQQCRRKGRR